MQADEKVLIVPDCVLGLLSFDALVIEEAVEGAEREGVLRKSNPGGMITAGVPGPYGAGVLVGLLIVAATLAFRRRRLLCVGLILVGAGGTLFCRPSKSETDASVSAATLTQTRFVGDEYALTYYQSATVMALQRQLPTTATDRVLFALGDPVFAEADPRYAAGPGWPGVPCSRGRPGAVRIPGAGNAAGMGEDDPG